MDYPEWIRRGGAFNAGGFDPSDFIGQTYSFQFGDQERNGRFTFPTNPEDRQEWKRRIFGQHYGAGPRFYSGFQYEEESFSHGDHDDADDTTYISVHDRQGWVADEVLIRAKCWRCAVDSVHTTDMCEPWNFKREPQREWTPTVIYSYELLIPDDALDLGIDDGAHVITSLDKRYSTEIVLAKGGR